MGRSTGSRSEHANRWVLADTRLQLLSVGESLYQGTSPRTALDPVARSILVPRVRVAAVDGIERYETIQQDNTSWNVRVIPVLGPVIGTPLAVLACYGPQNGRLPSPPTVGAWEWKVTPPGPTQQMRTYWSGSLFDVYGIPRPRQTDTPFWEGPQWLDELILDSDRVEIRRLLDDFLSATTDGLFFHAYRVKNPTTGEIHVLRYAGRSYVTDPGPAQWLRGVSTRIDHQCDRDMDNHGVDEFVNAAFTLSAYPLCAIDTTYEHVYMTSKDFTELGVRLPEHRHLPAMVHADDLPRLRQFLADAACLVSSSIGPVPIRFAGVEQDWKTLALFGTGVRLRNMDDPHHVLCRVAQPEP